LSYVKSCLCCYAYAFCLRTSKDSSMGEFDESIISCFNIIFSFILFRLKFILFKYYFLLDLFYFNCIFTFQERIFDRFSLGAKERGLRADSGWKNTRFNTKIYFLKSEAWHGPCQISHGRATYHDCSLAAFASCTSYLLVYFWPKRPLFLMEHSSDVFLRA